MSLARARRVLLPPLALLLLTLLLTWPTAATLTTHVVDRQDPLLNAWIMAWEARQLLVAPQHLFDANIFFPLRNTLAFSETLLSLSLPVMPLQWLAGDALLAYNVAFLLACFSTALGGYLLALYLTGQRGAALVAAVAFAWSPYRLGHLSQVQLLAFGWLPLALIYLDRLLGRGGTADGGWRMADDRRQRSEVRGQIADGRWQHTLHAPRSTHWLKDALLFVLFFLLQATASFYAALFSAGACALYGGGWLLWKRRLPRRALAGGALAAGLVALAMLPLVRPYFAVQRELDAGWTLADNERFSASLQAYGYAPERTLVWGPLTAPLRYTYGPCCPPDTLFPGLTLLALAGVALRRGGGRRGLWLLVGAVGFLLSLGPTLMLRAGEPTGLALPYRWLWEHVPGFDALRAPVRWAVLVTLALSMLAAVGVARLGRRWAAPLALALVLLEFAAFPLRLVPAPEPPDSLAWLAAQPPTRIVELPLAAERPAPDTPDDDPRAAWEVSRLLEPQFFSTEHWHTTPDGYSGYVPARHGDFAREMRGFPSARSVALLQGLGVRYVVVHEADLDEERARRLAAPLPPGVQEVARFGDERVLAVAPAALSEAPRAALPLTTLPAAPRVAVPLVLASAAPYVPVAPGPLELAVTWEKGRERVQQGVRVPWPLIVEEVAVLSLPLAVPAPGEWALRISGHYPMGQPLVAERTVRVEVGAPAPPRLLPVALAGVERVGQEGLRLVWQPLAPLERYYSVSVRLVDEAGYGVAQQDGPPGGDEAPTLGWQPGERYAATWHFPDLPRGATPADFRLVTLWYDAERGQPAWLWDGAAFVPQLESSVP